MVAFLAHDPSVFANSSKFQLSDFLLLYFFASCVVAVVLSFQPRFEQSSAQDMVTCLWAIAMLGERSPPNQVRLGQCGACAGSCK